MKYITIFSLWALLLTTSTIEACTTAIISGKATVNGRPLLFKQRDTDELSNKLVSFTDGKYSYIGLVNTKDTKNKAVWGGYNSAGFAIMNSASYNLNNKDSVKNSDNEGFIMKLALQTCATLADFEKLLDH
jgi:nitrous oxidase accessory protein NosD